MNYYTHVYTVDIVGRGIEGIVVVVVVVVHLVSPYYIPLDTSCRCCRSGSHFLLLTTLSLALEADRCPFSRLSFALPLRYILTHQICCLEISIVLIAFGGVRVLYLRRLWRDKDRHDDDEDDDFH